MPLLLLVAYGALRLSASLFQELRQIVFARVMARTSRKITLRVFEHLHALSLRFHLDRRTGGVARDVERGMTATSDLLDWTIYTILPTLLEVTIVCGILIVRYDWGFAAITLATLAVYITFTFSVTEWRLRYYRAANAADTEANAHAVDSLLNYETVKYFGNERHEFARYDGSLRQVRGSDGQEPEDARRAQHRPGEHRRGRTHPAALARIGRRRRRDVEPSAISCSSMRT